MTMISEFFLKHRWRIVVLLLFPWFFIGGPDSQGSRVAEELWNLGHIVFFGVFALEADIYLSEKHLADRTKFYSIMLSILGLATGVEACQSITPGRVVSFLDIIFGLAGGSAILVWKYTDQQSIYRKIALRVTGLSGVSVCLLPLLLVSIDEYRAWRDFPVLSDFESFLEVSRWESKGKTARTNDPVQSGSYALRVTLTTDKYSGIALVHFPEDWHEAKALTFNVYNPGEMVTLHYRIHDWKHREQNQAYSDRFNGRCDLSTGWNRITIGVEEIVNAPKSRKMEMEHIRGFQIFLVNQSRERILYIDDVKLLIEGVRSQHLTHRAS